MTQRRTLKSLRSSFLPVSKPTFTTKYVLEKGSCSNQMGKLLPRFINSIQFYILLHLSNRNISATVRHIRDTIRNTKDGVRHFFRTLERGKRAFPATFRKKSRSVFGGKPIAPASKFAQACTNLGDRLVFELRATDPCCLSTVRNKFRTVFFFFLPFSFFSF